MQQVTPALASITGRHGLQKILVDWGNSSFNFVKKSPDEKLAALFAP